MAYQRISVIGTSGSGKTTLARQLSQALHLPHVELDALYWGPNWTPTPIDPFQARVIQALSGDRWVVDGNYSKVRQMVWRQADTVVWLDYSLAVVLGRLTRRTLQRMVRQEELWNGNREPWQRLFNRDSILLWALSTYGKRRREYPQLLSQPEHAHLRVVQLRSPEATRQWLSNLL